MSGAAAWAGVDVGGRGKAFHLAVLDDDDRNDDYRVVLSRAASVDECLQVLLHSHARVVAIDAPSAWALPGQPSRHCERWFTGMSLCSIRYTPDEATALARDDHYYEWIEHGLELWAACRRAGIVAIECFPTASWTAWLGPRSAQSRATWTTSGSLDIARAGVRGAEGARNQDERDALAAALTALQAEQQPATVVTCEDFVVAARGTWPLRGLRGPRRVARGRLVAGCEAPRDGERTAAVVAGDGFAVEQIVSGRLGSPVDYLQTYDEWALVLEGSAVLEIEGTEHRVVSGDWILLPARVPHRLVSTEPGTSWLVVKGDAVAR